MFNIRGVKYFFIPLMLICIQACAGNQTAMDHTVYLYNASEKLVYQFQVEYGELHFPKWALEEFDRGGGGQYSMYMELPEAAVVRWKTEDGKSHEETVEIRSKVNKEEKSAKRFKVIFEVNEDQLSVYIDKLVGEFEYDRRKIN